MPNSILWTTKEDERLRQLVYKHGDRKWATISEELGANKGSKQCRRRWKNCLSLDVKKGSWSEMEDDILLKAHEVHGNRWTLIAKMVGGRTDNAVKNRWAALNRRKITYPGRRPKRRRTIGVKTNPGGHADFLVGGKNEAETMCGTSGNLDLITQELQCETKMNVEQKKPGTARCQLPRLLNTRNIFEIQPPTGLLGGGDFTRGAQLPDGLNIRANARGKSLHNVDYLNLGSRITSHGSLMEDFMIRPLGHGFEPYLVPNRDRIAHTRPPCFTHSELDMLLAALQACQH